LHRKVTESLRFLEPLRIITRSSSLFANRFDRPVRDAI